MGQVRDGVWTESEHFPTDTGGAFVRPSAPFRCPPEGWAPEPGRFHLYLSHACPWCHRTAIGRRIKALEDRISVSFVEPLMLEGGWRFSAERPDPVLGVSFVHELYTRTDPRFTGRATLPILWDRRDQRVVCNESEDILRMFDRVGSAPVLRPAPLVPQLDEVNAIVYQVNNGVYRCGFAKTQAAYEHAYEELFAALDALRARLVDQPYLCGEYCTEADIRLFVTLVRFDAVYFGHFKCNRQRIEDDEVLHSYLVRLFQIPAFRETTHIDEIKLHYYGSHRSVNPTGVVPVGPRLKLLDHR